MKSNPKSLSKNSSSSQIKFKLQSKQAEPELPKEYLSKNSSSLKLNTKLIHEEKQILDNSSKYNSNINKLKKSKSKRMESQPNQKYEKISRDASREEKNNKNFGWSELDKIKYELTIEKRLRQSLQRENQTLRKEINFLNNFGTSVGTSVNKKKLNNEESLSSNKQKILSRLNKKRDGVAEVGISDSESTGLYSGKTKYYEESINEMYEQYTKKRVVPTIQSIYEVMKNYFNEFKENYSKLFILFNNSQGSNLKTEFSSKIEDLLFLFQVPIIYKEKPKQLLRTVSKQKLLTKSKNSSANTSFNRESRAITEIRCSREKDNEGQYKSTNAIMEEFAVLLNIILKNNKLFNKFIKSQVYEKMLRKIQQKMNELKY